MNDLARLRVFGTAEEPEVAGAVCRLNVPTADVARTFDTRARVSRSLRRSQTVTSPARR